MVTQLDFAQVWHGLEHTGYWFFAVIALWLFLYLFNTSAWFIIINAGGKSKVKFWWLYKVTVSGFAFELCHTRRTDGESHTVSWNSHQRLDLNASSSVILYDDPHLQPFLVLVPVHILISFHSAHRLLHGNHSCIGHGFLWTRHLVLYQRIPKRTGCESHEHSGNICLSSRNGQNLSLSNIVSNLIPSTAKLWLFINRTGQLFISAVLLNCHAEYARHWKCSSFCWF